MRDYVLQRNVGEGAASEEVPLRGSGSLALLAVGLQAFSFLVAGRRKGPNIWGSNWTFRILGSFHRRSVRTPLQIQVIALEKTGILHNNVCIYSAHHRDSCSGQLLILERNRTLSTGTRMRP